MFHFVDWLFLIRYFDPSNSDSLIFLSPQNEAKMSMCPLGFCSAAEKERKTKRWLSTCKGHGIIWTREITKKLGWLLGGKYLHESTDFCL